MANAVASLTAFRNGMNDNVLDQIDQDAVAAASAAAGAARTAQNAVVAALQSASGVAQIDIDKAVALQTALTSLDGMLASYASLLGDGLSFSEFSNLIQAQADAIGASTTANANLASLMAAEQGHQPPARRRLS